MGRAQRNPSTREPGHADGLTRSAVESRWALPMLRYLDMPMGFAALYPSYGAAVPAAPMGFAALYPSYGHGAGQPESGAAFGILCYECLRCSRDSAWWRPRRPARASPPLRRPSALLRGTRAW